MPTRPGEDHDGPSRRFLGVETGHRRGPHLVGDTEPRVLGIPRRWFAMARPDGHPDPVGLLHPLAWVAWRRQIRRLGAYAPDFDEFRRGVRDLRDGPPEQLR